MRMRYGKFRSMSGIEWGGKLTFLYWGSNKKIIDSALCEKAKNTVLFFKTSFLNKNSQKLLGSIN